MQVKQEHYDTLFAQLQPTARGRPTPQYKLDRIQELLGEGISWKNICKRVHVTNNTIKRVRMGQVQE